MPDQRDLVLSPSQYAYVQDGTSGNVRVWVGPKADALGQNDRLVLWNGKKFYDAQDIDQSRLTFTTATENQYVILTNPAQDNAESFPPAGAATTQTKLDVGRRVNILGPTTFPLWPGQSAEPVEGHRLSFDEYLVVQVYEPQLAYDNQSSAVAESQGSDGGEASEAVRPRDFTMGERIVIKGTDVSFYIPPTGIEVLKELRPDGKLGDYVRKAAVVKQLEYVSLVNEKGEQRYVEGPAVVFPEPDETWVTERGEIKYRKLDLNTQSGLYIKVTQDHRHDGDAPLKAWRGNGFVEVKPGEGFHEGDELFITGKDMPIYMPRVEHSVIEYGENKRKHHAIALPAGEGRYVLDRVGDDGVKTVKGPRMFLPDPRTQVVVRRVLDAKTAQLWYPNNLEALNVNLELAGVQAEQGEQYLATEPQFYSTANLAQAGSLARSSSAVVGGMPASRIKRGTEYTPPRTVTLDTKYLGIPQISVWPGYAVMVMDPTGNRRVEKGPVDLLMEYHESLMALTLSTGRPKGTGNPLRTVYLRTINNAVGDRITVETRDLVPITLEVSLRVNFEGKTAEARQKWFDVEDYVALLTDHVRSKIRNLAKRHSVQDFYANTADLVRDSLLGQPKGDKEKGGEVRRSGLTFEENGMRLYDVEILTVMIEHPGVKSQLDRATAASLEGAIMVSQEEESTEREKKLQSLRRDRLTEVEITREAESEAALKEIERRAAKDLQAIAAQLDAAEEEAKVAARVRAEEKASANTEDEIAKQHNATVLARAEKEVELFIRQYKEFDPKLAEAIRTYGQQRIAADIATAIGPYSLVVGAPAADILKKRLEGTVLEPVIEALAPSPVANGRS